MALITGLWVFVVGVLTAVLAITVAEEIGAWSPWVVRSLIKFAVARLPQSQRERFEEEWQSHAAEVPGKFGKLFVCMGFVIAAHNMALIDRRSQVVEGLSRNLAQLDESHATLAMVVDLIRNEPTLATREDLSSLVNQLSSLLNESRQLRDRLATRLSSASAIPQTLVANLLYATYAAAIRRGGDEMSKHAAETNSLGAQIVTLVKEHTKRLSRVRSA